MKERVGGLLAIALGAVLIGTGIDTGTGGAVGVVIPSCGAVVVGAVVPVCPTGTITIHETTSATPAAITQAVTTSDPTPPTGGWKVTITSTCLDPATSTAVSQKVTVPNNGQATSAPLYVYTTQSSATQCSYTMTQAAVAGFTTTFSVASPFTIPFAGGQTNSTLSVTVTNSFVHVTPTSSSAKPSSSAAAASSSPVLATTGPRTRIGTSVYLGIGLVLLGIAMVFGGQFRRTGRRT